MYNSKELKLSVNGMELDYITFGKGDKPLIMIQGLNTRGIKGASSSLAFMYRIFAKEYKVYLFDRRPYVEEGFSVEDIANDIASAMDELRIEDAYVLGVSEGGMVAQYLAINRPELVKKIALAVTLSRNNDTIIEVINSWTKMAEEGRMKEFITDMAKKMYSDKYLRRYRLFMPLLTVMQRPKDIRRFVILAKSCLTCNTYEKLNLIKCPALVIGAKGDKITDGAASLEIAEKLGCRIHMYDDLGHAAYEEAKDFNRIVYDFFAE